MRMEPSGRALADYVAALRRRASRAVWGHDDDRPDGSCRLAPEWLVLVVNNFCNLRCRMCDVGLQNTGSVFYRHLVGDERRNMSLELLETILDQAQVFSPRPRVGLAYTEPLIHARILDLVRAVVDRGFFCAVTTNGYLLPQLAESLVAIGVHQLTVSVDGPRDVHDRIRGRVGSFDRLFEGVEGLNRCREAAGRSLPAVRFSYTVSDQNATRMLDFVRSVEGLRPAAINVSHLNFISAEMAAAHNRLHAGELAVTPSNVGSMVPAAFDVAAMWDALEALKAHARAAGRVPLTIVPDFATPEALAAFYQEPLRFVGGRRCTDPWRMMMVKTDGTVIPAHGRCYDVPVGNVREAPLAALWNGTRFRGFRKSLKGAGGTLPACARCCGVIGKSAEPGI